MLDEHVCEYECELSYRGELNYPSFPSLVTKKKKLGIQTAMQIEEHFLKEFNIMQMLL